MEQQVSGKKRVAVLFGGQSPEHQVSLQSSINVINAIDRQQYDVTLIGVDKLGRWTQCDESDYLLNPGNPATIQLAPAKRFLAVVPGINHAQLIDVNSGEALAPIDVAFSVLHGAAGEDGSVPGLLRVLNIPHAGPDVLGSAVCMDKDMTKRVLRDAGIAVAPSVTLFRSARGQVDFDHLSAQLGLPLFIKPASLGSSVGVSKAVDRDSFMHALDVAFSYDHKVLVEQAVVGREVETAVLGNEHPQVSVCGEILANDDFYAYDTKYLNGDQAGLVIPAELPEEISERLRQIASQAFCAVGCSVMARVDFFVADDGRIIVNEINTLPGFTSISMYPKLWQASGLSYTALVSRLLALALERDESIRESKTDR